MKMKKIIPAAAGLALLGGFLHWSNQSILLTKYEFDTGKLERTFSITQVSDLQSTYFGKNHENLLRLVSESQPEIIAFTGDLMDRNHTNFDAAREAMAGLLEIAPVYYVNGNHELAISEAKMQEFYEELSEMGVHILFDKSETISARGVTLNLIGISEYTLYESKFQEDKITRDFHPEPILSTLSSLTKDLLEEDFNLLLVHEPQYLEFYDNPKVDLILSGHAHGGQIRLPLTEGLYAPGQGVLPKLTNGIHEGKYSTMIINRGLGNSVFPFRVFNRPEIVSIKIK